MREKAKFLMIGLFLLFILVGCGTSGYGYGNGETNGDTEEDNKLEVVTTYSVLYDIVKNIGGDRVKIHSLAPIGGDPHEYEPLPLDVQNTTDADVVFYNGLNLEAGNSWFENLLGTAGKKGDNAPVFRLSQNVDPMFLTTEGNEGEEDPHAWLDVQNGIKYAENARDALIKIDPEHSDDYEKNAENYINELEALHHNAFERFKEIPKEKRILVTSEGAFKYFSKAYDFEAEYIWEINQENQGTPNQITRIVDIINEKDIQALFLETSIDPRSMEMVSRETGIEIKGDVFTDSLGKPGEEGDTYIKMMEWNIKTIFEGLTN
ncbi:metal ABC transporter substrate-binding protein [Virgibacillus byunsanensis]|uniref:Metal ABC transporter substrate-binding protein n=1 Tax=Virgibacillus byunsanensis TaxID=570945 RepID=A0ABW3LM35_9BACI